MQKGLAALLTFSVSCALWTSALGRVQRDDGASIVNSGSTNAQGYHIDVSSAGRARIARNANRWQRIDARLARKFFADLKAARAAGAPGAPCKKSASLRTRTMVVWHAWTSRDLECPVSGALLALKADVQAITSALAVQARRRPPGRVPVNGSKILIPLTPTPPQPTPYP